MAEHAGKGAPQPGVRMEIVWQPVGADHGVRELQHPLHVGLVHRPIDRAGRLQPVDRLLDADSPVGRDRRQFAPGLLGRAFRPGHQHLRGALGLSSTQHRRGGDVGVGVEPDLLLRDCRSDPRQGGGGAAEILPPDRLVMRNHDRHPGSAADRETLFEAVEYPLALIAHVCRVKCARRMEQGRQRLDLGGWRMLRRGISEPARHADRAGVERFL